MKFKNNKHAYLYIFIGILSRLIPHPANFTPLTNLCLFSGMQLSRRAAICSMLLAITLSNIALALLFGYPLLGYWTLFTYTGFIGMILVGQRLGSNDKFSHILLYVLGSALGFWLWTNFGEWLCNPIYVKNVKGLIICYVAALPFLRDALLGDFTWAVVIFGSLRFLHRFSQTTQFAIVKTEKIN